MTSYPKSGMIPYTFPARFSGFFAKNMLEEQHYPDLRKYPDLWQGLVASKKFEGAPIEAYDMMGWTLSYQFNLQVKAANTPLKVK